jgi:protein involved in polysaccharide export with SLBB domain
MKNKILIMIMFCIGLALSACATAARIDADTLAAAPENSPMHQRRIVPGDTVHITIWEVDQPKEIEAQVKDDGTIDLLFMTGLKVAGLTEPEMKEYLTGEVSYYYVNPRLTASLSAVIYLIGEVKNPGVYALDKGRTLVSILAAGGGPTRAAKLHNTLVIRGDYNNNPTVIVANASRVLRKGDLSENVMLQAGDIVFVPSTVISDVNYFITQIKPILDIFVLGTVLGL